MADKDTVALIKKHDEERPGVFAETVAREGLAAGLNFLVADYRRVGDLYDTAKIRGGKQLQGERRTTAAALALLHRGVLQAESATPRRPPVPHPSEVEPIPASQEAAGERLERLDTFVREQAERGTGQLKDGVTVETLDERGEVVRHVTVYGARATEIVNEKGEAVQYVQGVRPELTDPPTLDAEGPDEDRGPDPWMSRLTDPPAAPSVPPALADPAGAIPGKRLSWSDLQNMLAPGAAEALGLPEHLSHSQRTTLGECGTKYVMQRSEVLGVVQVPQWALVGGKAFHAAAEWFERTAHEVKTPQYITDRIKVAGGLGEVWRKAFGQAVTDEAIANPAVPMSDWRAANRGKENYTWWLVEGETMLINYVAKRTAELGSVEDAPWRQIHQPPKVHTPGVIGITWEPMIETEGSMDVAGTEYKVVLDQVWEITGPTPALPDARKGDLLVDDLKSGKGMPVETGQLEEYALWLVRQLPESMLTDGDPPIVWGRFYDARRGTYTEAVNLLERASWQRFETEVRGADAQKRAGIFMPRPSSFCGACSVKHACPVFATNNPTAAILRPRRAIVT